MIKKKMKKINLTKIKDKIKNNQISHLTNSAIANLSLNAQQSINKVVKTTKQCADVVVPAITNSTKQTSKTVKEKISAFSKGTKETTQNVISKTANVVDGLKSAPDKFKSIFNKYNFDDAFIHGNKNSKVVIFFLLLCTWFVLDCVYDYINYIKSLALTDFMGFLIAIVSLLVISLLVYFLVNDIWGIVTLNKQQRLREKINKLIKQKKIAELKTLLINYKLTNPKQKKQLQEKFKDINTGAELVAYYEELVLSGIDKKVDKIIRNYAISSSLANVSTHKSFFNIIATFIIFIKMVIDIAKTYQLKLGLCTFSRIIIIGILGSSFLTSFIKIIETVTDNKIVNVMKDLFIPNIIIRQLGIKVKYAIRPIAPRNSNMFKESVEKINESKSES